MNTTEDIVRKIIDDFIQNEVLFTAVDVSNEVKKLIPTVRHREVRDIVRGLYSDMQVSDYSRTEIDVVVDGATTKALLYHPLFASFDLDNLYNTQKRSQKTAKPSTPVIAPVAVPVTTPMIVAPAPNAPAAKPSPLSPKQLWDKLFSGISFFKDI